MGVLEDQLAACGALPIDAFDVIADAEGWRAITDAQVEQLEEAGEDAAQMGAMRMRILDMVASGRVELIPEERRYEGEAFNGDDVAMVVRMHRPLAPVNPIVSYLALATLLSTEKAAYHEAKNYWLSAACAVIEMSRRRPAPVRGAYVKLLSAASAPGSVVQLPVFEILAENSGARPAVEVPAWLPALLVSSMRYAVEKDAEELAAAAFPLLRQAQPG